MLCDEAFAKSNNTKVFARNDTSIIQSTIQTTSWQFIAENDSRWTPFQFEQCRPELIAPGFAGFSSHGQFGRERDAMTLERLLVSFQEEITEVKIRLRQ